MLEQLALSFLQSDVRVTNGIHVLVGVTGFVFAVRTGTRTIDLSRSKYFVFLMMTLLVSAVIGMTTSHLPDAARGGYAWIIVMVSVLNALFTSYALGLLSLWRAMDCSNKRWPALLGLVPLVGLYLLFAPPLRGSRHRTPWLTVALLLIGGIVAGTFASMMSRSTMEQVMRSTAASSMQVQSSEQDQLPGYSSEELINDFKAGHALTCKTAVRTQSERENLGLGDTQIEQYCECLGNAYFGGLSQAALANIVTTGQLPDSIMSRREDIQTTCFATSRKLPFFNQIIVSGDNHKLRSEVQGKALSEDGLGSALLAAAGKNNVEAIAILLAEGAPVDHAVLNRTPLIVAITERNDEAVAALLKAGADPNYVSTYEWRPLHYAINAAGASLSIIRQLVSYGADPDGRTNLGITPLHRAASFCNAEAVLLLTEMRANKVLVDHQGDSAAQRAVRADCPQVAALLQ